MVAVQEQGVLQAKAADLEELAATAEHRAAEADRRFTTSHALAKGLFTCSLKLSVPPCFLPPSVTDLLGFSDQVLVSNQQSVG